MSKLPLVIVNPSSAAGATNRAWPGIAHTLATHFGPFEVQFTEYAGHAIEIAREQAASGRSFIIACGGDGTASEVANGILLSGADCELGLFPSGTGGDFRRSLRVPARAADTARALKNGQTRKIDVGLVEYLTVDNRQAKRYFINVASFGIASEVLERLKASTGMVGAISKLNGRASYAVAALQSFTNFEPPRVTVKIDDRTEFQILLLTLCVANAIFFGGGMRVAPKARLEDGLLDIVAVNNISALKFLSNTYRIYTGTHLSMEEVNHCLARRVEVSPSDNRANIKLEADGEVCGKLPATFTLLPSALKVRFP
jgi:diacylglycerol kinase (ATP)